MSYCQEILLGGFGGLLGGFLGNLLGKLAGPLMKVAMPVAKNVLAPLGLSAAMSAIDGSIKKDASFWSNNLNKFK